MNVRNALRETEGIDEMISSVIWIKRQLNIEVKDSKLKIEYGSKFIMITEYNQK